MASSSVSQICLGDSVLLIASGADDFLWLAEASLGALTNDSTWATPTANLTYQVTGTDASTQCSDSTTIDITVLTDQPQSDFTFELNGTQLELTDNSLNGTQWTWLINGDSIGSASTQQYTMMADQAVEACLVAANECLSDTSCQTIVLDATPALLHNGGNVAIWPNPASEAITVDVSEVSDASSIRITDLSGRTVFVQRIDARDRTYIRTHQLPSGLYLLEVYAGQSRISSKRLSIVR